MPVAVPAVTKIEAAKLLLDARLNGFRVRDVDRHGHWTQVRFTMRTRSRDVAFTATFDHRVLYALEVGWPV